MADINNKPDCLGLGSLVFIYALWIFIYLLTKNTPAVEWANKLTISK